LNYLTASLDDIGAVSDDFVSSLCKLHGQEVDMWSLTKVRAPSSLPISAHSCKRLLAPRSVALWTS
jgi:hypothetical protein